MNRSLDEQIADRVAEILHAASEIHDLMTADGDRAARRDTISAAICIYEEASRLSLRLPQSRHIQARDSEVADLLDRVQRALIETGLLRGPERDVALERVEALVAPYALVLFYEIQRLDALLCRSTRYPELKTGELTASRDDRSK